MFEDIFTFGLPVRLNFHETFNVLLPENCCNKVSVCVTLCAKNKQGK